MINTTDDLCKACDGRVECAPTAILLISLVHTLYGQIGSEPDYFRGNDNNFLSKEINEMKAKHKHLSYMDSPPDEDITIVGEYDFIVVGGGTAGCVVASRLSENKKWKVLLIEAGPEEPKMTLIPGLASELHGSSLDWKYKMRPRKGFCQNQPDNSCDVVQGRVLGGTSSINDLAYIRGSPADYDEWANNGNEGWSSSEVLPYFMYSEGNRDQNIYKNKYFHSKQGPLDVARYSYKDINVDILLSSLHELGFNYTDVNGKNQLGFTRIQSMSYLGERISSYKAFIEPIRKFRSNLEILTEALVTKILFHKSRDNIVAYGVEYLKNGTIFNVKTRREIILSAGAINSPKLLMQSGVGPREYLEYLSIKTHVDLPVGANFQDHLSVCLPVIQLSKTRTLTQFPRKIKDITTYYTRGTGPLSANYQVIAFLESSISDILKTPDIEIRFRGYGSNMYYENIEICVSLLTPKSRGHVILNATRPIFGNPLIYPNFLKDPTDERKLLEGIQQILRIFDTESFKRTGYTFDPVLLLDNECKEYESVSDSFWSCIIKQFSAPLHNYAGTCKMGSSKDPESVVDKDLIVFGIQNLRVVDASIMPKITRGSTAAPVIMIAEKASDMIKTAWY